MTTTKSHKNFFLLSFLPALAYWYLEENYPIQIAITGGLALAILEIGLEKVFTKHVHTLSKLNFFLILVLGGISLLGEDGLWFKLQPFFTGIALFGFLFYRKIQGEGLLVEMSKMMGEMKAPQFILERLEWHLAIFFLSYGFLMGGLAIYGTTSQWAFFKTIGFYIAFAIFMLIEIVLMRIVMKRMIKQQQLQAAISAYSLNQNQSQN